MKRLRLSYVIHLFALLHGVVCALCAQVGVPDTILLTLMTMVLTVLICTRHELRVEGTALAIIFVNIGGFLLGTSLASLFDLMMPPDWVPHMLATFFTTEIIGWTLYWITSHLPRQWYIRLSRGRVGILIFAIIGVFLVRMAASLKSEGFFVSGLDLAPATVVDVVAVLFAVFFAVVLYGVAMHERELGHRADLRYATLKNLVNPHFLFNSLNILDGLIEPENKAAKDYLRRLSQLYRYMTVHEKESLVYLEDERNFARDYIQLLSVRFPGSHHRPRRGSPHPHRPLLAADSSRERHQAQRLLEGAAARHRAHQRKRLAHRPQQHPSPHVPVTLDRCRPPLYPDPLSGPFRTRHRSDPRQGALHRPRPPY